MTSSPTKPDSNETECQTESRNAKKTNEPPKKKPKIETNSRITRQKQKNITSSSTKSDSNKTECQIESRNAKKTNEPPKKKSKIETNSQRTGQKRKNMTSSPTKPYSNQTECQTESSSPTKPDSNETEWLIPHNVQVVVLLADGLQELLGKPIYQYLQGKDNALDLAVHNTMELPFPDPRMLPAVQHEEDENFLSMAVMKKSKTQSQEVGRSWEVQEGNQNSGQDEDNY